MMHSEPCFTTGTGTGSATMRSLGLGRSISLFIHKLFISFTFEVFALSCTQSNERPHKSSKTKYSKLQFQGMFIQTLPALCDPAAHKQGWPTRPDALISSSRVISSSTAATAATPGALACGGDDPVAWRFNTCPTGGLLAPASAAGV